MNRHLYFLLVVIGTASLCTAGLGAEQAAAESGAAPASAGDGRVAVLITFRNIPGPSERALVRGQGGPIKYSYRLVPGIAASLPERAVASLLAHPSVVRIDPDGKIHALDAELDTSWGVKRIGAGTIHDGLNKGTGIKVAIIDTGIDYGHPDLALNYQGGYDFVNDDTEPLDDHSHGTHVAGIVAARDNETGVVGVAPEASLYALKILNASGSGNDSDMIAAVEWAIDNSMQVINLSLGTSADPGPLVQAAFDAAEDAGIVTVAAAGNSDIFGLIGNTVQWPARYESVIAVGATDSANSMAYYSSTGPELELAAPGNSIYSTVLNGAYGTKSGTSMAAPHVAGAAALVIAAGYGDVRAQLIGTADDLGLPGRDTWYGYGLVDAEAAAGSSDPTPQPPVPDAGPDQTVTDADANGSEVVTLDGSGSYDPDGSIVSWDWDINGDGTTDVSGETPSATFVGLGIHTVTLTVTDDDGLTDTDTTTVTVSEPASPPSDDPPSVSIVDPSEGQTVAGSYRVLVSATDDHALSSVELSIDGGAYMDITASFDGTHYYYDWDTTATSDDDHTLQARATDGALQSTDSAIVSVTVDNAPSTTATMHVYSIDVYTVNTGGGRKRGYANVVIVDSDGVPVAGATVSGTFSGDINDEAAPGITGPDGSVVLATPGTKKGRCKITFCVGGVTHPDLTYEAGDNNETCDQNY